MFQKAAQAHKNASQSAPPHRPALAKQLFPSSSPSSSNPDIRDQFKKVPSLNRSVAADVSARTTTKSPSPLDNRPVNLTVAGNRSSANHGALSSLYAAASDSFKSDEAFVDLTGSCPGRQEIHEPVYFAEDDFSDDANLDLDFAPPSALPQQSKPQSKENAPPPTYSSQSEIPIPWSSSPASHKRPSDLQRPPLSTSSLAHSSWKRESSDDLEIVDAPIPKKAKKRVLPASWSKQESEAELDRTDEVLPGALKTPTTKASALWDASASAIKQQKKALKNHRHPRDDAEVKPEEMHDVEEKAVKPMPVSLTDEQEYVLDLVVNRGQSVFFTGPAGAGKSVLMRSIIAELKKKHAQNPERVAVTASTGLAACNIGGITLHSFSGIGLGKEDASALVRKIKRNPKAKSRWLKTKCLIIDEISMVDGDLFDKLSQIGRVMRNNGRPWGGIQLIITGDFFQLPPVPDSDKKRESKFAFDAATWNTSIDHTIGLTQVFRQRDPEFARMLNEMRVGKISPTTVNAFRALSRPLKFDDGVDLAELYPTRAQVEGSNEKRLRELSGRTYKYEAMDAGDPNVRDKLLVNMMAPKALELKVGAQVMLIKNLDDTLVNGSLGKVVAFSDEKTFEMGGTSGHDLGMEDSLTKAKRKLAAFSRESSTSSTAQEFPVVQFISTGGTPRVLLCQPEEWKVELPSGEVQAKRTQLPLILAWALSIHKAQGQTLERVTVNLGRVFEKGQAYVALSRATTQQGLRVIGFEPSKVMAHHKVVEFYDQLSCVADAAKNRQARRTNDYNASKKPHAAARATVASNRSGFIDTTQAALASYGYQ